ncbi:MAG TPA: hypothetical protein VGC69_06835 [Bordetella sp.]
MSDQRCEKHGQHFSIGVRDEIATLRFSSMRHLRGLLLVLPVLFLSACSDQPSTSDVQDSFSERNGLVGCDIFKTKFEKINGVQRDERHYVMEMKGEIVMKPFKKNLAYASELGSYLQDNKDAFEKASAEVKKLVLNYDAAGKIRQQMEGQLSPEQKQVLYRPYEKEKVAQALNIDLGLYSRVYGFYQMRTDTDPELAPYMALYYQDHKDELDALEKDQKLINEYNAHKVVRQYASSWKTEFIKNIKQECRGCQKFRV